MLQALSTTEEKYIASREIFTAKTQHRVVRAGIKLRWEIESSGVNRHALTFVRYDFDQPFVPIPNRNPPLNQPLLRLQRTGQINFTRNGATKFFCPNEMKIGGLSMLVSNPLTKTFECVF